MGRVHTRFKRLKTVAQLLVLPILFGLVLAACGGSSSSGSSSGTTLTMGEPDSQLASINDFDAVNGVEAEAFESVYPALIQENAQGKFVGNWAKSWTYAPNGLSVTFHLPSNAKWSDGVPMTSADAVWMCETVLKYAKTGTSLLAYTLPGVSSCTAPNPTTLVVHLRTRTIAALMPLLGTSLYIVPKHVWASHVGKNGYGLQSYQPKLPLVSGGPYMITSWQASGTTLFKRNPYYSFGPKPQAENLAWEYFSNPAAMTAALQSGEIDVAYDPPAQAVAALRSNRNLAVVAGPGVSDYAIAANRSSSQAHKELLNPQVLHAFSLGINRSQIVEDVFAGLAQPITGPLPGALQSWWGPESQNPYNVAEANSILDGLGYKKGGNGVRVANGHPMSYNMLVINSLPLYSREAGLVASDLAAIGVHVTPVPVDPPTFTKMAAGPSYKGVDLDMWNLLGYTDPDTNMSAASCHFIGAYNFAGYCNQQYDRLLAEEQALPGAANLAKRMAVVRKIQQFFFQNYPFISFVSPDYVVAYNRKWTNISYWGINIPGTEFATHPRLSSQ